MRRNPSEGEITLSCLFTAAYGCCLSLVGDGGRRVPDTGETNTFCLEARSPTSTPPVIQKYHFRFLYASSAASRWLDAMTQQLNASKYELCKQEYRRRHPKTPREG